MNKRLVELTDLIKDAENEIKEKELIKSALLEAAASEVKRLGIPYTGKMMKQAYGQQNLDTKSERSMYERIRKDMLDRFFRNEDVELISIMLNEQPIDRTTMYDFIFKHDDLLIMIAVPDVKIADVYNVKTMKYGQYAVFASDISKSNNNDWKLLMRSYDDSNISETIANCIKAYYFVH